MPRLPNALRYTNGCSSVEKKQGRLGIRSTFWWSDVNAQQDNDMKDDRHNRYNCHPALQPAPKPIDLLALIAGAG